MDTGTVVDRIRAAIDDAYRETRQEPELSVNDTVEISGYLWNPAGEPISAQDLQEGARLTLAVPGRRLKVEVLERRSKFTLRLAIDENEHMASFSGGPGGPFVKLRLRDVVISASVCVLEFRAEELDELLDGIRRDNHLPKQASVNVLGFLRHVADLLLAEHIKGPGKIRLALGGDYAAADFVRAFTLQHVRDCFPGLFYEAVHHELLAESASAVDHNLSEFVAQTMLARARPEGSG
jgi:hypothetical protein